MNDQRNDQRCEWGAGPDPAYRAYHDTEWGLPVRDERHLFELLVLEGAQAGLSWSTILHKREGYRRAFAGFDVATVAAFDEADAARLLGDAGIVRNRAKIAAAIGNARATLELHAAGTTLVEHLWSFVGGMPVVNRFEALAQIPSETDVIAGDEPGPAGARLPIRGPDDLLRADAVRGPRERPRDLVLPLGGGAGRLTAGVHLRARQASRMRIRLPVCRMAPA